MRGSIFIEKENFLLERPIRRKSVDEIIVGLNYSTEAYEEEGCLITHNFVVHSIDTIDLAGNKDNEEVEWNIHETPMGIWKELKEQLQDLVRDCG